MREGGRESGTRRSLSSSTIASRVSASLPVAVAMKFVLPLMVVPGLPSSRLCVWTLKGFVSSSWWKILRGAPSWTGYRLPATLGLELKECNWLSSGEALTH